jgi:hypothetical protein
MKLNAAQVIGPRYGKVFNGIALPFCKQLANGILRGARFATYLDDSVLSIPSRL